MGIGAIWFNLVRCGCNLTDLKCGIIFDNTVLYVGLGMQCLGEEDMLERECKVYVRGECNVYIRGGMQCLC